MNHPSMRLRWPDGVESTSEHLTWQLLVQYLRLLHDLGDDVTIVWIKEIDE